MTIAKRIKILPPATFRPMSSSASAGGSSQTIVIFLALYIILVLRRVYRGYKGARFSEGGTLFSLVVYVALGSFLSILSFFEGVSVILAVPYAAVLLVSAAWSHKYADRRISFWRGADGTVYFRGGVLLYLVYVVGFVARVSIDIVVLGPNFLTTSPTVELTSTALYATIATDLLLMFGLGLLIGRNVRVLRRGRLIKQGKEVLPDSPPPLQPVFGSRKDETGTGV
jgi:hypothetical protein